MCIIYLLWFATATAVVAEVRSVPVEYSDISQALAACQRTDTVLIASGRYVESLTVPDFFVTIASDFLVTGDTVSINSTTIESPLGFASIIAPDNPFADSLRIVGLRFVGGTLSGATQRGGIISTNRSLCVSNCNFDSVSGGASGVININGGTATANKLAFTDCNGGANSFMSLTHSTLSFDSLQCERIEASQSLFRTESCALTFYYVNMSNAGRTTLPRLFDIRGNSQIEIESSTFRTCHVLGGFVVPQNTCLVNLSCNLCVFDSIQCGFSFLELDSRWAASSTITFRDCLFEAMSVIEGYAGPHMLALASLDNVSGEIIGNRFIRNHRRQTSALLVRHNAHFTVERNYFIENTTEGWMSFPGGATVLSGNQPDTFRENIFIGNQGNAVDHFGIADPGFAEHNYWGHPSGPYNAWSNPEGRGDTVDTLIFYEPWEEDTLFLSAPNDPDVPITFALGYPYPNPFNSSVTIEYALTREQDVTLEIYDVLGRQVKTLLTERQVAGVHSVLWKADEFASGLYFAKLSSEEGAVQAVKLMLLK